MVRNASEPDWTARPLDGVQLRALALSRVGLFALGVGTGSNRGRVVVLSIDPRTRQLAPEAAAPFGPNVDPRALYAEREGVYWVGGEHPPLVRLPRAGAPQTMDVATEAVTALEHGRDDTLVALHGTSGVTLVRYGSVSRNEREDVFAMVRSPQTDNTFLVHTDGQFVRGRPGREFQALTDRAPSPPVLAALSGEDGALVYTRAGTLLRWGAGRWTELRAEGLREPVALLPVTPPLVVTASGAVFAVGNDSVRPWP